MAIVHLPDGGIIIDDAGLYHDHQARYLAAVEGRTPAEIAEQLQEPLASVERWLAAGPYETATEYWQRIHPGCTVDE